MQSELQKALKIIDGDRFSLLISAQTELSAVPHRRSVSPPKSPTPPERQRQSFRKRYDGLETRRAELSVRLQTLGDPARQHAAYKRALKLLNEIYRKEKLAQRLAVLNAAAWLIDVLENLTMTL